MTIKGENERLLHEMLEEAYPGQWLKEYKGIEGRLFRFDAANIKEKICIEIEGGIWLGSKGGHTSGVGYEQNLEKYNLAVLHGWRLLRYAPSTLKKHPEQIILDVMDLTGITPKEITTRTIMRAKIAKKITLGQVQVRLS